MKLYSITTGFNIPAKKNNKGIRWRKTKNGKKALHRNRTKDKRPIKIDSKTVVIIIRYSGGRKRDLDNMATSVIDALCDAGKIDDDNIQEIGLLISAGVKVEPGNEGADILII